MKKQETKPIEKIDLAQMTGRQESDNTYIQDSNNDIVADMISLKAIEELLNMKKLKTISRVKFEQVPILSKLYLFSNTFGENFTKKLADLILELQISTSGLGRKELVQVAQRQPDISEMLNSKDKNKGIFR